jgi:hypothetical protein
MKGGREGGKGKAREGVKRGRGENGMKRGGREKEMPSTPHPNNIGTVCGKY